MNYHVQDGDKTYGPFTLAELHAEVQAGRIPASALVQSQGMTGWLPASQVLGNIPIPTESTTAARPPFESQVETVPLPPNLHWAILLLLVIFTNQLFNLIWALVLGNWARKLDKDNKPLVLVAMYPAGIIGGIIASANNSGGVATMLILGGGIAYLFGIFTIKAAMETYYNSREKMGLTMGGVKTFFLSSIYLQYNVNKIARWKKTGQIRDTRITP